MSAKMLAYNITVDYSLLVNIPPVDYNNIINKPIIANSSNDTNGTNVSDRINENDYS